MVVEENDNRAFIKFTVNGKVKYISTPQDSSDPIDNMIPICLGTL